MKTFYDDFLNSNKEYIEISKKYNITVLGDKIEGFDIDDGHQLHRCPAHKKYEAELLLKLPLNYSFLDIGSHFGDTVITMALHAKNNKRPDIRFFAFEPNNTKCEYIIKMNKLNNLNISVINAGVGDENCDIVPYHYRTTMKGTMTYNKINQMSNESINSHDTISMITLNSIKDIIEPLGFMHIDAEGWESKVLEGSSDVLDNDNNKIFIIAECWDNLTSKRLGFSANPELDILNIMKKYKYIRQTDLIDQEKNLVFFPNN